MYSQIATSSILKRNYSQIPESLPSTFLVISLKASARFKLTWGFMENLNLALAFKEIIRKVEGKDSGIWEYFWLSRLKLMHRFLNNARFSVHERLITVLQ